MGKKLTKAEFTRGFEPKSFLGSAFPSVRMSASRIDKIMGTKIGDQFKELKQVKKTTGF